MKNRNFLRLIAFRRIFAALLAASFLFASNSRAQIISNGTGVGATVLNLRLVPSGGTGTLLINPGGVLRNNGNVRNETRGLTFGPAGNYFVTNRGMITNSGTTDSHQGIDVSVSPTSTYSIVNAADGVIALNPANIYEAIRSFGGTGSLTNYGLIQALGSAESVTSRDSRFTIHNEGTIDGGIGFWGGSFPGGTSLTVNQVAGVIKTSQINPFLGRSFYTFASNTVVNMSGGEWFGNLLFEGGKSSVNLSGGEMNGDFLYRLNASTNDVTVTGGSLNGNLSFGGSAGTITFNRPDNYTYSKVISGNGALVQAGAGTVTLSGANSYTQGTVISNGATLVLDGGGVLGGGTYAAGITNDGTFIHNGTAKQTLNGAISGTGAVVKSGSGDLELRGNNTYSGGTWLNKGIMNFGPNSLGTGTITVGAADTVLSSLSNSATLANDIVFSNFNGQFYLGLGNNSSLVLNGTISGGGPGVFWRFAGGEGGQNTGALTLNGTNSFAGTLEVWRGPLTLGNSQAAGNSLIQLDSNLNPNGSLQFSSSFAISNNIRTINTGEPIGVAAGRSNALAGVISGNGSINKVGAGSLFLLGNNTFSGGLLISAGSLYVGDGGTTGTLGAGRVSNNASLFLNRSDSYSVANAISGSGSLTKNGAGTATLTADNSYTGGTVVNAGTLVARGFLANNASNTVTVNNGGTFVFGRAMGNTFGIHTTPILTPMVINAGGLVTNSTGGEFFFSSLGPLTLNGGTLAAGTTGGPAGYSYALKGPITVNSNSIISGPGISLGAGAVAGTTFNVASNATLAVTGGLTNGAGVSWPTPQPSFLTKSGAGTILLNGTNTYTGDTTISNGAVVVGGSGVLGGGNYDGNVALTAAGSKLVVDTTANQNLGGIISGAGSLVKTSTGTLTITGPDNSYTGTTTIGGGTLVLNGTHTGGGAYTVQNGATLKGEGRTTSAVIVDSGGNITPGNSPGELTIGDLTLNGTLNIFIDGDSTSLLTVIGNADVTGGGVSFTSGAAPTEDVYVFLSASGSLTSPFATNSGLSGALSSYQLLYDANDGIAFLKLNSVTNVVEAIFPGPNAVIGSGTTNFNVYVYNGGTNTLSASASGDGLNTFGSASNNIAPTNGTELSSMLTFSNGSGTFGTNTAAFNANLGGTPTNVTFDIVVYDHASNVVTGGTNFNFGAVHASTGFLASTNSITVSNKNDSFRIAMGVTNDNTTPYLSIDTAGGLAQGESAEIFATLDLSQFASGRFTNNANLIFYDDSELNGASTNVGTVGVQLTGYVYTGQGVWIGSGGDWQNLSDWQEPGGTPGLDGGLSVNDTALFGTNGNGPVALNTNAELLSVTFSNASSSYVLAGTGTLVLTASGGSNAAINTLAGSHTISNAVAPGSDLVLSNAAGTDLTLAGVVSGANGLLKTGAGTTALAGTNTYSGGTTVGAGILIASNGSAFGTGNVTLNNANTGTNDTSLLLSAVSGANTVTNAIYVAASGTGTATLGSTALGTSGWATFAGPIELDRDVTLASAPSGGDAVNNRTDFSGGIRGTGNVTITSATNSRVVFLGADNTFAGNLIISPNSTLQLSDGAATDADFIPDTANVTVGSNGFLKLAKGNNSEGIAGLSGSGTVEAIAGGTNKLVIGNNDASASFSGTLRDNGGTLDIEKSGAGTQTFSGAGTYAGVTYVSGGTLSVAGPGSISGTREVWVYNSGNTLEVLDGGSVASAGDVAVGPFDGTQDNQITVRGTGSTLSAAGSLYVGYGGTNNQLNVSEGTVLANNFYAGLQATSADNVTTISNGGSLIVSNAFVVGVGGAGNGLQVLNGGVVAVTGTSDVVVGNDAGATGNFITISGAGSAFTNQRAFVLGLAGPSNSLNVDDGAELRTGNARIGRDAGSDGNTATVTGAGSTWGITGTLRVGSSGNSNSLEITDGGIVNVSSNVFVGYLGTSASGNSIRVAGTDSQLVVTNGSSQLVVGGNTNSNSVTVADGGELVVNSIQLGPQGVLRFGEGAGAGFVRDTATINATNGGGLVEFNHTNDTYNFVAEMKGDLGVVFNGPGTTTIGGSNSYTGATTINGGTVVTTTTNALGNNSAVTLNAGVLSLDTGLNIGSLVWDAAGLVGILDAVSAANALNIAGNLVLTNGPTNMFDLRGAFVGSNPTQLLTAANMTTNNFDPSLFGIVAALPGDYILTISNNALWIDAEVLIVDGGVTTGGTNSYKGVRYVAGSNPNLTIPVGSTINIAPNPVVMSNNSTTTVNGTFSAPSFTVQRGSVLTGAGTMIGNVINSGLLNPGNPTGQMTIQGNFTQMPSGTTGLQVAGSSTYSQLYITGTATLAGTLQVTPINGYALQFGDKYQFLTALGGISGEYDAIAMPSGYRGRFLTSDNNTKGSLLVAPQSYTQVALTPNQQRVAAALDAFIPATSGDRLAVSTALDELRAWEYSAAFEAIMPSIYASIPTLAFNQANALNTSMFQRMWMQRISGTGFSTRGMALAPMQAEMGGVDDMQTFTVNPDRDRKWGAFVDGNGIFATANSAGVLQDYRSQSGGVAAGASYKWNENFATGVYVGYQGLQARYDNGSRLIDNAVRFGGFGTVGIGGWYLNGLVGGAYHAYDADRSIEFGTIDRTANGKPGAGEFDLALGTGYDFKAGNFTFGPVTSMQYTYIGVQGFNETGADSLNLDVNAYNASSLLYSLGAQVAYRWEIGKNFAVTPMLSASWQHEFMQNAYPINAAFNTGGPSSPFFFQTAQPQQDYFYGGAGVGLEIGQTWDVGFYWNASAGNSDLVSQNFYLSIGAEF